MHVVVIPSEPFGERDSLEGIFQRDQASALKTAGLKVGVLAVNRVSLRCFGMGPPNWRRGFQERVEGGIPVWRHYGWASPLRRWGFGVKNDFVSTGLELYRRYVLSHGTPDLVHAHNVLHAGVLARAIREAYRVPYVLTEHSSVWLTSSARAADIIEARGVFSDAAVRISVSSALRKRLASLSHTEWRVVPNMLPEIFEDEPTVTAPRMGCDVICVARFDRNKNQSLLIRAFKDAFNGSAEHRLHLVGDGAERTSCLEKAGESGIARIVHFHGELPRRAIRDLMLRCDLSVLASRHETFGVALIEAMACGLPVIATRSGGADEIVTDDVGRLVPCDDQRALASALIEAERVWKTADRSNIRGRCLARYGSRVVVDSLLAAYRDAR